jgi:hypothetical protein
VEIDRVDQRSVDIEHHGFNHLDSFKL